MQLTFDHLAKAYDGIPALRSICGQVDGEILGLLGPNGAGKTTLMRICVGLLQADSGDVGIRHSRGQAPQAQGAPTLGFVPERGGVFPELSGIESVVYSGTLSGLSSIRSRLRSHEMLDLVGIEEARYRPVDSYSTGMRQRIKIAMALVHDPDVLLLDEPTSGLDPGSRREILEFLRTLPALGGPHVLLSTHLLNDVETLCDGCMILHEGGLRFAGLLSDMGSPNQRLHLLRVLSPSPAFVQSLEAHDIVVTVGAEERLLEIDLGPQHTVGQLLQWAREAGATVLEAYPIKMPIEERFRRQLSDQDDPS